MGISKRTFLVSGSLGAIMLASVPAFAQEAEAPLVEGNEIVVTANLREQVLQDVPIAINVISSEEIRNIGATDLNGIVKTLAGVELRSESPGQGAVAIRGISELNTNNIYGTTGTAVGLYIDEAPFSVGGFFPQAVLADAARVEVLRGPQGTIFGEGSLAGTIRIIGNKPDSTAFAGAASVTAGAVRDGGTNRSGNLMLNVPLVTDVLALRAVGFYQRDGGWIDRTDAAVTASFGAAPNPILGPGVPSVNQTFTLTDTEKNANDGETYGGRFQLGFTPTDSFSANFSALIQRSDRGFRNRGSVDREGFFSTDLEHMNDDFELYSLVLEKRLPFGKLLSSTNYFSRNISQAQDQLGIIYIANQIGFPITGGAFTFQGSRVEVDVDVKEFNQELRFVSDFGGAFELTAGGFYRKRKLDTRLYAPQEPLVPVAMANAMCGGLCGYTVDGAGDLDSNSDTTSRQWAGFAEGTLKVSDQLTLLLGARYFNDRRRSETIATSIFGGIPFPQAFPSSGNDNVFNPRVSITFEPSPDLTLYTSVSRGFRSGGQNDLFALVSGAVPSDISYAPERMTAYEAGVKSAFGDGLATFNAAVFYNDWTDLQVVTKEGAGGVGEIIGNAGKARSYGVDLEAIVKPTEGLTLAAGATILDTRIGSIVASGQTITGARIPNTANFSANASITYEAPLNDDLSLLMRAGLQHRAGALSSLLRIGTPFERLDGYTTLDLRVGVQTDRWSISLFADNVTDAFIPYSQFVSTDPSNPNGGDPITGKALYFQGSPRVIGISARVNFGAN